MNSFYNQDSGSGTKRGKAMNAAKFTLTATVLAAAFGLALSLGPAPALADKPNPEGCHEGHEECPPGGGEDPPTIEPCDMLPCIADVGKTFTDNTPAKQYAGRFGYGYIKIESNDFGKILETLTEEDPAGDLCANYDVLIFNWSSPTIKNLNWQRLLDYMACGGNVIFEDPRNVGTLGAGVSTLETTLHSRGDFPLTITLEPVPVLTLGGFLNSLPNTHPSTFDLFFVNKHIIFDEDNSDERLTPFLSLENDGGVVGLYGGLDGEFGGGRIVLTGPDNNYHGDPDEDTDDPADGERMNHYDLLFNEINWLLD